MTENEWNPNLNYNANRYSAEEWALIQATFSRKVWGVRIAHTAPVAGRSVPSGRLARWVYVHDLGTFVPPFPVVVLLAVLAGVMTVVGLVAL